MPLFLSLQDIVNSLYSMSGHCIKVVVIWNIIPCSWALVYLTRWYYSPEILLLLLTFMRTLHLIGHFIFQLFYCSLLYNEIS
jgi:hypothetical protein